jgi:hypothetical protein
MPFQPRLKWHPSNKGNPPFYNADRRLTPRGAPNVVLLYLPDSTLTDALLDAPTMAAEAGYIIDGSNHSDTVEVYRNDRAMTADVTAIMPC